MRYIITLLLPLVLCLTAGAQATDGNIWQNGRIVGKENPKSVNVGLVTSDELDSANSRIVILEKQVAFLMRDNVDVHRRLDSLINEMRKSAPDTVHGAIIFPATDKIIHAGYLGLK